ncbi:MAG: helical backbone metal receptor [Gemmatimonadaceae bacterium]|nr:helical backbone metal receptor [Gemmatimonadaceae bacterium]
MTGRDRASPYSESPVLFAHRWLAAVLLLSACAPEPRTGATALIDDHGDTVQVAAAPAQRIVSLNPATTEALFAMGAGARVVGRTHWDLYPEAARAVPDLGAGMQPNVEAVLGARPDLVVLYASAGNRDAATKLRAAGVRVIALRTDHVADLRRMLGILGRAVGDTLAAIAVADSVEATLAAVRAMPRYATPPRLFWRLWDGPIMTVGRGSFLHELVEIAGGTTLFADRPEPSPTIALEEIVRRDPDFIVTGPVSLAAWRMEARWQTIPAARAGRFLVVDTALVGRPGVRMGEAARHLRALLDSAASAAPRR